MKRFLTTLSLAILSTSSIADGLNNLTLTENEMQKLKQYFPSDENAHFTWKGDPIVAQLPIGKEKRIVFSENVKIDVNGSLDVEQLRLINNDKSIYLTAKKEFPVTRVYATLQTSGKVILLDLKPSETASANTQYIDVKLEQSSAARNSEFVTATIQGNADSVGLDDSRQLDNSISYVDLIRFAWKQAYAPDRIKNDIKGYPRAAMHTTTFVSDLVYGDKVIAHPDASWVMGGQYVTLISLQNKYPHPAKIDLKKDLCGSWMAASLYPRSTLKPHGDRIGDSTTLIVVSQKPFGDSMGVCHGHA